MTTPAYNVYSTPPQQIITPAVVIRPDDPWITPSGGGFTYWVERYVAICVVSSSDPESAIGALYDLVSAVVDSTEAEGWAFESVAAPVIDETTGSPLLAAAVRLSYRAKREV